MKPRDEVAVELADLQGDLDYALEQIADSGAFDPVDPVRALAFEKATRRDIDLMLQRRAELRALPCEGCGGDRDEAGYCNVCGKVAA